MECITKGIAHCGKAQFQDAMKAFDLGFMYVDADLNKTHLLLLIKAHWIVSDALATYTTAIRPSPCSMQTSVTRQFYMSKS
jgi:hypothetical protein